MRRRDVYRILDEAEAYLIERYDREVQGKDLWADFKIAQFEGNTHEILRALIASHNYYLKDHEKTSEMMSLLSKISLRRLPHDLREEVNSTLTNLNPKYKQELSILKELSEMRQDMNI